MPNLQKLHRWTDSPAYKQWVLARDRALEKLLDNARRKSADVMRKALTQALWVAKTYYTEIKNPSMHLGADRFEHEVRHVMRAAIPDLLQVMIDLRQQTYVLSKSSEAEIIARLSPGKTVKAKVDLNDLASQITKASVAGGDLQHRTRVYIDRLTRKIVNQAQTAALNDQSPEDFLLSVAQAFPKHKRRTNRRTLKPNLLEADRGESSSGMAAQDFIDEEAWTKMLDSYSKEYIPQWRGPESILGIKTPEGEDYYAWEYERDITSDFVSAVRNGQVDAAKDNGITDFVWIAVLDDKTCENCCGDYGCVDFDGLLISEVRVLMKDDSFSCPAHFNCRCSLAPATDSIPEKPDVDYESFDKWLET